jgi:DNA-binding MarR family transcriptional regulator
MTDIDTSAIAARIAFIVGRLNRRLATATGGLSHSLLSTVATVAKHGPIRFADLAQLELVSAPSITRLVAELEGRGLVARSADPEDGRASLLEITPAGMDAVLRARAARGDVVRELIAFLDSSELAAIEAALPALEKIIGESVIAPST